MEIFCQVIFGEGFWKGLPFPADEVRTDGPWSPTGEAHDLLGRWIKKPFNGGSVQDLSEFEKALHESIEGHRPTDPGNPYKRSGSSLHRPLSPIPLDHNVEPAQGADGVADRSLRWVPSIFHQNLKSP